MIDYQIRKSTRARMLRITIKADGTVIVTVPHRMSMERAEEFIREKEGWINAKVDLMKKRKDTRLDHPQPKGPAKEYAAYKEKARACVLVRLEHFNTLYGFSWNSVSIKNTSSRWGSCSKKGNLNFSYKILMLAPALADYLVVHELCHLKEFNHSARFWKLVEKGVPDYKLYRNQLRGL